MWYLKNYVNHKLLWDRKIEKKSIATTTFGESWFERCSLTFYAKFVDNYKLLTKITVLSELSLLNKNCVPIVIWFKNKNSSTCNVLNLRPKEMYLLLLL